MTYLHNLRRPAAAIFDVDGTLVDSMAAWRDAPMQFLAERGIEGDRQLLERLFAEQGFSKCCAYISERWPACGTRTDVEESIFQSILRSYQSTFPAMPHAAEYLRFLHDSGIPVCVLTANQRNLVEPALDRLGMTDSISFLMSCCEENLHKRDTALFLRCTDRLGLPPERCVMFEDMPFSMKTAKEAGLLTVGFCNQHDADTRAAMLPVADRIISDYRELLDKDVFAHDVECCG